MRASVHFFFFFAGRLAAFAAASAALAWAALFFSARAARAFTLGFPSGTLGIGIPFMNWTGRARPRTGVRAGVESVGQGPDRILAQSARQSARRGNPDFAGFGRACL